MHFATCFYTKMHLSRKIIRCEGLGLSERVGDPVSQGERGAGEPWAPHGPRECPSCSCLRDGHKHLCDILRNSAQAEVSRYLPGKKKKNNLYFQRINIFLLIKPINHF